MHRKQIHWPNDLPRSRMGHLKIEQSCQPRGEDDKQSKKSEKDCRVRQEVARAFDVMEKRIEDSISGR